MDMGFDSLAAELESESTGGSAQLQICNISRDPEQPRTEFDDDKLQRLADSINAQGVIQPIVVRQDESSLDRYIIIAGERRWRAAQIVGLETIPGIIKEANNTEIVASQIIENIDREGFTLLDEVKAVLRMCEICGNASKAADALGKPKSWISKRVAIGKGGEILESFICEGYSTDVQSNYQLARLLKKFPEEGSQFINNWIKYPNTRENLRNKVIELISNLENPPVVPPSPKVDKVQPENLNATDSEQVEPEIQVHSEPENNEPVVSNKPTITSSQPDVTEAKEAEISPVKKAEDLEEVSSYEIQGEDIVLITNGHRFKVNEALIRVINDEL